MKLEKKAVIREVLDEVVRGLKEEGIVIERKSGDGRIDSSLGEEVVIRAVIGTVEKSALLKGLGIEVVWPGPRCWYDLALVWKTEENEFFVPVNVKISNLRHADNLSSKGGLLYALTGVLPKGNGNEISWDELLKSLFEDRNPDSDSDYYFLIVDKSDPENIFWNSLRGMTSLVSNGNNPPFQACWDKNRSYVERNYEEAWNLIVGTLEESLEKRARAYLQFCEYKKQYEELAAA